jgi:hypothetical protein
VNLRHDRVVDLPSSWTKRESRSPLESGPASEVVLHDNAACPAAFRFFLTDRIVVPPIAKRRRCKSRFTTVEDAAILMHTPHPRCLDSSSGTHIMLARKPRLIAFVTAMLVCSWPDVSFATEQAQQRRAGRDVRQDTRQNARHTKQDCRAANQQANAHCRHDKRQTKQHGRQAARDIKY